ncbi:uncharacterized protein RCC_02688 [Ramularia collo-cygni]|uniref:Heterokaryon incompatibility domain-containing protein n=1 Tax=Ramularia collo-cygni TaxID=112498 RepID=A0A2D3V8Y2_9PEZI|nr:uncharacterized protein RCC_02688 [Ramularia collo-cygni]CZT16853.1 uncharacterized protein RCC_02688 [Ramularia collo-cygni]
MRLLNVGDLRFKVFNRPQDRPKYVIASHRWCDDEASFQDLRIKNNCDTQGYKKVEAFAKYVQDNVPSVEWLWIDTVCINQNSMPELGEAINLMFDYYKDASLCIAWLADVGSVKDLETSEWFTRGWTLQELLAPPVVVFTTKTWDVIGNKGASNHPLSEIDCGPGLEGRIATITNIPEGVLQSYDSSSSLSIDEKRKWMDGRETTREEDMFYALYGICGVTPGVNYGEKYYGAKERLRRAILEKEMSEQTIFSTVNERSMPKLKRLVQENPKAAILARNESNQTALHLAAEQGNVSMVEFLIRNDAEINAEDDYGRLPLHYAVISCSASVVRALVYRGADKTAKDDRGLSARDLCNSSSSLMAWFLDNGPNLQLQNADGWPALCLFARRRDMTAVRTLLELGADINVKGPDKHTPLFEAAKQDHKEMLEFFLTKGADITPRNSRNDSVLCQAGWHGHTRIGEVLLNWGASIDAVNQHGYSALHECCEHGHIEMALMLIRREARFDIYNQNTDGPIHQACRLGHISIVQQLLEMGDDVNHRTPNTNRTPLGEASQHNRADVVELLLSRGVNVEEWFDAGGHHQTPLIGAAAAGHTSIVDLLLNLGKANIEAGDEEGTTAICYAVDRGRVDTTKQLLLRKPNLEVRGHNWNYTPLHRAAQIPNPALVSILLEAGADPNVRESHKWTPIHEAAARGGLEIVKQLLNYGADPDPLEERKWSPLRLAIWDSRIEVAMLLLKTEGVDADSVDYIDETPLHEAAQRGFLGLVKELIQRGAVVDRSNHMGLTPLHFAVKEGHLKVATFLIDECKADVNHATQSGMTPLHQAAEYNRLETLKLLLERGASKDSRDGRGFTARSVAAEKGHLRAVELTSELSI